MAYGDIFEVDGQLYEVTPVGYMPVSPNRDVSNQRRVDPPASMITEKPSETGGMLTGQLEDDPAPESDIFINFFEDYFINPIRGGDPAELVYIDTPQAQILGELVSIILSGDVPEGVDSDILEELQGITLSNEDDLSRLNFIVNEVVDQGGINEWVEEQRVQTSVEEANNILSTLVNNPDQISELTEPQGEYTQQFLEEAVMGFIGPTAGSSVSSATHPTTGETIVLTGGAGVSVRMEDILKSGGQISGILDVLTPYIPGISLPNWLPTAGVIFLPTVGKAIDKLNKIVAKTEISTAIEEGDLTEILGDIGSIIVNAGGAVTDEIQNQVDDILKGILKTAADPKQAGTIIGGVFSGSFPSGIPDWLSQVILRTLPSGVIYSTARDILVDSGAASEDQLPFAEDTSEENQEEIVDVFEGPLPGVDPDKDDDTVIVDPIDSPDFDIDSEPEPQPEPQPEPEPDSNEDPPDSIIVRDDRSIQEPPVSLFTDEQYSVIQGLFADIINDASLATIGDIAGGVTSALISAGIIDDKGNVIRPDLQSDIVAALTNAGILNENGEFVQQVIPDVQSEVLSALTSAGIIDADGNVIRQEAVDVEGGVTSALQALGLVNADGQLTLDVSDSVLLALQNVGIVDANGNVIEQDVSGQFLTTLQNIGLVDEEGNIIRPEPVDVEGGVMSALQSVGLVDSDGQLTLDIPGNVLLALQNAGVVDAEGNVIQQDVSGQFLTTLQNIGLVDEEGNIIRQEAPDIEGGVISALQTLGLVNTEGELTIDLDQSFLTVLQNAGIVDEQGNVITPEAVDVEAGVLSALQSLGVVNADGELNLDIPNNVLIALENAGIVDSEGNVIEQDVSSQFLTTLQNVGLVDEQGNVIRPDAPDIQGNVITALQTIGLVNAEGELALDVSGNVLTTLQNVGIVDAEGNVIRQEAPDIEGGVISALQTIGLVDANGQLALDVSGDVLLGLQNAGIVDADGNVIEQDLTDQFVTTLQEVGVIDEEGASLLATSQELSNLRDELVASGVIGEDVTVASQADLNNLVTALTESGLLGEETIFATTGDISNLRDDLVAAGLIGEGADVATGTDLANLRNELVAIGLIGEDAVSVNQTVRTALSEFEFTKDQLDQISGAINIPPNLSGEDVTQLFTDADLATATNVTDAVNSINESLGRLGFATPQNVKDILSQYAFSEAQINQIVNAMPAGLQLTDIDTLIDTALTGVATSQGLTDATNTITTAISGLNFATDANVRTALSEFRFNQEQLDQITALMPDTLTQNELTLAINASLENIPTNADMDEAFSSITKSLTDGFNAITGEDGVLERQTTMLNAISGLGEGQRDILTGQQDILTGQQDILTGVGEESQRLEDVIMSSTGLLAAIGAGGLGGAPAAPTPQPYRPFEKTFDYAPRGIELLKPEQRTDPNKEIDRLLIMGMGGKKQGMLV